MTKLKWNLAKWLYPVEFALGQSEAQGDVGMTYGGSPNTLRSIAYDLGRAEALKGESQ